MKAANIILGSFAATIVIVSGAFAQQTITGMITQIDRLNGTIAIQQTQSGTVGSNSGGAQNFKVQDTKQLENFHAGDRVNFSPPKARAAPRQSPSSQSKSLNRAKPADDMASEDRGRRGRLFSLSARGSGCDSSSGKLARSQPSVPSGYQATLE